MNAVATPVASEISSLVKPDETALLVIDMQNDFCAPGGYIDSVMKRDVTAAQGICATLQRLVDSARSAGIPVIWIGADYSPERIPAGMQRKLSQRGITQVCCAPGSWGAQWFCVEPNDGETVIIKHNYCGFSGTNLHKQLQQMGIRTLVATGVQTQICVESTVREGHALGYHCVVPRDAVASHTPPLHDASLTNIQFLFGEVCDADDLISVWNSSVTTTST